MVRPLITTAVAILIYLYVPEVQGCECGDLGPESCLKRASAVFEGRVESMHIRTHALFEGLTLTPDGHFKILHLWPGQNPPPRATVG